MNPNLHGCGAGGNMHACHTVVPVFDPWSGQVSWVRFFFGGFSLPVRQMSGNFRLHGSPNIIGHQNHPKSFITGANDLRC